MLRNEPLLVQEIWQKDPKTLGIVWSTGEEQHFDVRMLRLNCPCASCIDENTNKRTLKESDVSLDICPLRVQSVGRYALKIEFNDGHSTGIYRFEYLQRLQH